MKRAFCPNQIKTKLICKLEDLPQTLLLSKEPSLRLPLGKGLGPET